MRKPRYPRRGSSCLGPGARSAWQASATDCVSRLQAAAALQGLRQMAQDKARPRSRGLPWIVARYLCLNTKNSHSMHRRIPRSTTSCSSALHHLHHVRFLLASASCQHLTLQAEHHPSTFPAIRGCRLWSLCVRGAGCSKHVACCRMASTSNQAPVSTLAWPAQGAPPTRWRMCSRRLTRCVTQQRTGLCTTVHFKGMWALQVHI